MTLSEEPNTLSLPKGISSAPGFAHHSTYDLSPTVRMTWRLQAAWVNRYGRSRDHILPTGGYKQSGIGKDLGREACLANR